MATITVGTNSYVTEAELATYAADRAITIEAADTSVLLIKAMDYIENRRFSGFKTTSEQALQFPRNGSETVPEAIKNAQMVAALLIDEGFDLTLVIEPQVKREKIDAIEVEYQDNAASQNRYTLLDSLLAPYLAYGGIGSFGVSRA